MQPIGFSHFARIAPNHLAVVAPDGRHWSRGELQEASLRHARRSVPGVSLPAESAEYLALLLAFKMNGTDSIPQPPIRPTIAAHQLLPPLVGQAQGQTFYLGASLDQPGASQWAVEALDCGFTLIICKRWQLQHFFQSVQRYQVTDAYLTSAQMAEIRSSASGLALEYNLSSLTDILVDGKSEPARSGGAHSNATGQTWL